MKQHTLSLWLGGVLFGLLTSAAQAEPWTLEHTLTEAQRYSAELSASRNEAQALDAMADSATQLPDPKLKFGIENVPVQGSNDRRLTREGMTMQKVGIMQSYVSSEKRERKAQTFQAQARSVLAKSEAVRAALQRDTAQAWLDLALAQQALNTARTLVRETERQRGVQKASVGAGSAMPDSVLALQMILSSMRDKETLAQRDVQLAQSRLLELTGHAITAVRCRAISVFLPMKKRCRRESSGTRKWRPHDVKPRPRKRVQRNLPWRRYPMWMWRSITPTALKAMTIWLA